MKSCQSSSIIRPWPNPHIVINIYTLLHVTHIYHCKKENSNNLALRLNRICSYPNSLDGRCNDLKKCLIEKGDSEREVRKHILKGETPTRHLMYQKHHSAALLDMLFIYSKAKKMSISLS